MRCLIFDAGPLINFSMNSSLHILERLKKEFKGDFLITKEVKEEIIDRPKTIPRFELGALRLEQLFNKGIIKHANLTEIEVNELREIRDNYMKTANSLFRTKKRDVHLLDKGECAALALSFIMKKKTKKDVPLVVDERTTRMLCEKPENLKRLMEKKLHASIQANTKNYDLFRGFKIIRSTELALIAHRKNLFDLKNDKLLEAMIYGLKFKGASISEEEVRQLIRM